MAKTTHEIVSVEAGTIGRGVREMPAWIVTYKVRDGVKSLTTPISSGNRTSEILAEAQKSQSFTDLCVEVEHEGHIGNMKATYIMKNGVRV